MGVLEPLEQVEFLRHPVPPHQLLVHLFDRDGTFSGPVVAALDNRETAPGERRADVGGLQQRSMNKTIHLD